VTLFTRLLRFAGIGGLSTAAEWGLLAILTHGLGLDARLVNPFAYAVGIGVNFLGSRFFTFAESKEQPARGQATKFLIVQLIGLGIDQGLVLLSRSLAPRWGVPVESAHWPGKLISLVLVAAFNFTCHRLWTFRGK
jgi:putative flippase GtrA